MYLARLVAECRHLSLVKIIPQARARIASYAYNETKASSQAFCAIKMHLVKLQHMSTATLEIYNALIDAGVTKEKAERAAKAVISRQEATAIFATKDNLTGNHDDLSQLKVDLIKWMVGLMLANIFGTAALIAAFLPMIIR